MKHAFLITAHKDAELVNCLVRQLSFGDVFLFIDLSASELYSDLKSRLSDLKNVHFIEDRHKVNWSGLSIVQAQNKLLQAACGNKNYDYIHNLSGQDLLLLSQQELDNWLIDHGLLEYLECRSAGNLSWRLKLYSLFRENRNNRKIFLRVVDIILRIMQFPWMSRKYFSHKEIVMGSNWFSITGEAAEYVLKIIKENKLEEKYKYTACPDEHFYQMILNESKFKNRIANYNGRYIKWESNKSSPGIISKDDYSNLMSKEYIFARKFDRKIDSEVIEDVMNNYEKN